MSDALPIPESTWVRWYHRPAEITPLPKPEIGFDHPVATITESIALTMQFLAANGKPFARSHTRPEARTVEGLDGNQTAFWIVYEPQQEEKIVTSRGIRTESTYWHYGFDASGLLLVERVVTHSWEDRYHSVYYWPEEKDLPEVHRTALLDALLRCRRELSLQH